MAETDRSQAEADGQDRQRRAALADAIDRRRADIEQRWLAAVQRQLGEARPGVSPTDLRDAIGEYLVELARAVRGAESAEQGGNAAWAHIAREHAVTRVRLGFDIDQLVREFILLRKVLFAIGREEGVLARDLRGEQLGDLIGAAIASSVKCYVESRDVAARRDHAEHIGFLTHELRNPLSTVMLAAGRLRRRPEIAALEGEALDMLERALERVRALIDRVLLSQRLDAQEMECCAVDTTLGRVMLDGTRAAAFEAAQKGLGFSVRHDPDVTIHVDPSLAASALQNVVDNAVKFTDRGQVEVIAQEDAGEVVVHVSDCCDGLSAAELETIFEPFKRAHHAKPGAGLGLAIARRAIEAQGGRIGADSLPEHGCHFWLTFPKPRH